MKHKFVSDKDCSLLRFLESSLAGVGRERIKIQLKRGEVRVNGVKTTCDTVLKRGDETEIFLPSKFDAQDVPVIYEDDNIMIADKPPFLESEFALPAAVLAKTGEKTVAAHRLDTNTTGLIILCKSEAAQNCLKAAFAAKLVKKKYIAEVFGCPTKDRDVLTAYLKKDKENSLCKVYSKCVPGAKEIITEYRVLSRGARSTLILSPVTGRTHQLRAHMAFMGFPIVGDNKYGDVRKNREAGFKRQKLRAVEIEFGAMGEPLGYLSGKRFCLSFDSDIISSDEKNSVLD